uniref:Uncharacterized protein n=1 Tax=viral metagenome TaxID=1070528 RepID=A0A6M3L6P5_9ZZZZ
MELTCIACTEGTASDGNPCSVCGGDGIITLTDNEFRNYLDQWVLHGRVWNEILTALGDIFNKCNDIKEKVDEIKAVVDEL